MTITLYNTDISDSDSFPRALLIKRYGQEIFSTRAYQIKII